MLSGGGNVATYRSRAHDSLGARLLDVVIGLAIGVPVAVALWALTLWALVVHG